MLLGHRKPRHVHFMSFASYPLQNVTSSSTANAVLEAARDIKAPIIIQTSQGGSAYFAGKGLPNSNQEASILGAIAAAKHVRTVAKSYGM